jgi:hypothetical protein
MSGSRKALVTRSGWRLLPLLAVLFSTVACLEHTVLLKLRPDGSGELIETTFLKGQMLEMARAMAAMEEGGEGAGILAGQADEKRAEAEARAAQLGEGVTFVSWEALAGEGSEGERAVYRFADVSTLRIAPAPASDDGEAAPMGASEDVIRFRFGDGAEGSHRLVAVFGDVPAPEAAGDAVAGEAMADVEPASADDVEGMAGMEEMADAMGAGMMEMMKPFLQGMKMQVLVEVEGEVVTTDAPFSDGSTVTLLALDFDQIVADPEAWKKLSAMDSDASLSVLGPQLQGLPGVRAPGGTEVAIEFREP